jgi:hypothetical protein
VAVEETRGYERVMEKLGPLVEEGTITQAQAEAVAEVLAEGPRHRPHGPRGAGLETVAEFLGISVDDIRAALEEGQTLADVAADNGSSAQALIDELVAEAEERLDQAIADGRLDEAEKADKLAEITERVTDMVNGEFEFGRPGGERGPRPGGPGRGPGPEGGDTVDA